MIEFNQINYLLLPLKSLENDGFSDDFKGSGSKSALIHIEPKFGDDPWYNLNLGLKIYVSMYGFAGILLKRLRCFFYLNYR